MKAIFRFLPVVLLVTLSIQAQEKIKCEDSFRAFEEKVNAGDYSSAYAAMPELRKSCRGYNENLYRYSETILKAKLDASSAEEKKLLLNDLTALYTEYEKFYPKSDAVVKKAVLLYQNKLADDAEVYNLLDKSFAGNKQYFTDHDALEAYWVLYLDRFKQGTDTISADGLVEKYAAVSGQIRVASNKFEARAQELLKQQQAGEILSTTDKMELADSQAAIQALEVVSENIDILASRHLSCTSLEKYYSKNYEFNAADVAWLKAMINTLTANKCHKAAVLEKGASELYKLSPGVESAFIVGTIYQRKNEVKKAALYFEEAAQLEANQAKKADIYYRIASVYRSTDKAAAKKYALMAARHNPSSGKPYIFLAELYSSATKECGLSDFDRKALVWLSIETVKKAETAEAKYKPTVASMIKNYSERLPSKEEVKKAGRRKGDKITYGCWINETVTIPNL